MIRLEPVSGDLAAIVLDRPEHRNALTPDMLDQIPGLIEDAQRDGARAIVLRGEGRVFCAGFDMRLCLDDPAALGRLLTGLSAAIGAMRAAEIPIVVACHGAAIAGGCALLGGADVVVADAGAKLGYPVVKLGVSPAVSAPYLRQSVGDGIGRRRLLDSELMSGRQARQAGLVHELVEDRAEVAGRAIELANELGSKPRGAVSATKRWLGEVGGPEVGEVDAALRASLALVGSDEERERLAAAWGD